MFLNFNYLKYKNYISNSKIYLIIFDKEGRSFQPPPLIDKLSRINKQGTNRNVRNRNQDKQDTLMSKPC